MTALKKRELTHQQQREQALFEGMTLVGIPKHLHILDAGNPGLTGHAPEEIVTWAEDPRPMTKEGIGWNIQGGHLTKRTFILMARASYMHKIQTRCISLGQVVRWLDIYDDEEARRHVIHTFPALFIKDFSDGGPCLISEREQFIVAELLRYRVENKLTTHLHTVEPLRRSQWWNDSIKSMMIETNRTLKVEAV